MNEPYLLLFGIGISFLAIFGICSVLFRFYLFLEVQSATHDLEKVSEVQIKKIV